MSRPLLAREQWLHPHQYVAQASMIGFAALRLHAVLYPVHSLLLLVVEQEKFYALLSWVQSIPYQPSQHQNYQYQL